MRPRTFGAKAPRTLLGLLSLVAVAGVLILPPTISGAPAGETANGPRRWALVVGVSAYEDREIAGTVAAASDSRALASALNAAGWHHVIRLADDVSRREVEAARAARRLLAAAGGIPEADVLRAADLRPTRARIAAWVEALANAADGREDGLLIAFSGRTAVVEDGHASLLARDSRVADLAGTGIGVSAIRDRVAGSSATTKVLILDACRPGDPVRDAARVLLEDAWSPGLLLLNACAAGQVAYPLEAPGRSEGASGAFAHFLAQGLRGEADDDRSKAVTARELHAFVASQVAASSRGKQTPVMEGGDEVVLARGVEAIRKAPPRLGLIAGGIAAAGGLVAALGGGGGGGGGAAPAPAAYVRGYVFKSASRAPGRQAASYLLLRAGPSAPEGGSPAVGAVVTAPDGTSTSASASGEFALGVADAQCTVTVSLAGYDPVSATLDAEGQGQGQGKPPAVLSAWAVDATHVDVVFSKLVDPASATDPAHYAVVPALAIHSARLQPNGTTVRLTTAEQTRGLGYTLTAVGISDGKGHTIGAPGSSAVFTGEGDPPQVVVASAPDSTHVDVTFNEVLDPQTASVAASYTISPALAVTAAALQADGKTVRLTTGAQTGGVSYTVSVSGVRDAVGNLIGAANNLSTFAGKGEPAVSLQVLVASAPDTTHVDVTFSGALDPATVSAPGSYRISPSVSITGAQLQADGKSVRLTTGEMREGLVYTLIAEGVKGAAGDGIVAPNDRTSFSGKGEAPQVVSAASVDPTHVEIRFNEALQGASVPLLTNFSFSPLLEVTAAGLQTDGRSVLVTTEVQFDGSTYTVTVANVTDVAGNPVGATNTATFTGQGPRVISAAALGSHEVEIRFSRAMDAATLGGYTITPGTGGVAVTVTRAHVAGDNMSVRLETTEHTNGVAYTVQVAQGKDLAGNPLAREGNTGTYEGVGMGPLVSAASSVDPWHVLVEFNEELDRASAETATNYTISYLQTVLPVTEAALQPDLRSVLLTTGEQWSGRPYGVIVRYVRDDSPNPMEPGQIAPFHGIGPVTVVDSVTVDLILREEVTNDSTASYAITSTNGAAVTVVGAVLGAARKSVRLSTTEHTHLAHYTITVTRTDAAGNPIEGSTQTAAYGGQGIPPRVVSAAAIASTRVEVRFDEALGSASAESVGNYVFSPALAVQEAALQDDGQTVLLTAEEQLTGREYSVTVSNVTDVAGNRISGGNSATFVGQGTAPRVVSAAAVDSVTVQVTFSEPVTGAELAANYTITPPDGGVPVTVSAAKVQADKATVILTTGEHTGGASYTVTVKGVTDLVLNPIAGDGASATYLGVGVPPKVVSATATDPWHVSVVFDEAVDKATAEAPASYSITPDLPVVAAALQSDGKSVRLTTGEQTLGAEYTMVVTGVKDGARNAIPTPGRSAVFTGLGAASGSGQIAYTRNRQIWVIYGDGSWNTALTSPGSMDQNPVWSPDGSKIAFESFRDSVGVSTELYVMDADGTGQTRLTSNDVNDRNPSWSPDGSHIVCESWESPEKIYILSADGDSQVAIGEGIRPVWSPDGSRIAFVSTVDFKVYTVATDGTGRTCVSSSRAWTRPPTWSPDGSKIAWEDSNSSVYMVNADGTNETRIGTGHAPSWSPDGTRIAYNVSTSASGGLPSRTTCVALADGGEQTILGNAMLDYLAVPVWSPDGAKIAYSGYGTSSALGPANPPGIFVMDADGTGQTRLTSNDTGDRTPVWRPRGGAARSRAAAGDGRLVGAPVLRAVCDGAMAMARLTPGGLAPEGGAGRAAGLRFVPLENERAGRRLAAGDRSWGFAVAGSSPGAEVTLSWPDLSGLGRDRVVLEDLDAGVRRSMRTTAAYTFRASEGGRRFRVSAGPRTGPAVAITGLEFMPGRGNRSRVARFALSSEAVVDLEIVDAEGRVVAIVVRSRACTAGINQLGWTGELRPGLYLLRATATTDDGTRVRAMRPVMSVR